MKELEFVKGILITPDGIIHTFGTHSYNKEDRMDEDKCHDAAFKQDILPTPWFQQLQAELGFQYDGDTIHRHVMKMASKGIISLINASDTNQKGEEFNVYCIHTPQTLTDAQTQLLEAEYDTLKELLQRKKAYFEAVGYDPEENYIWQGFVFDLDDFYDRMNINTTVHKRR